MNLPAQQLATLRDLTETWTGHEFVLIGAGALGMYLDMAWRRTEDLDLTVALSAPAVEQSLANRQGWRRDPRIFSRWHSPAGLRLDIVPASAELLQTGVLDWGDGFVMNLTGLDLAFRHAITHPAGDELTVRVAALPVLAFLKMLAYLNSPGDRERDLIDLAYVMDSWTCGFSRWPIGAFTMGPAHAPWQSDSGCRETNHLLAISNH